MAYAHAHPHSPAPQRRHWAPWVWGATLVMLVLWTGLCLITAWAVGAVLGWLPEGALMTGVDTVSQWSIPAWLAPWVDTAWLDAVMQSLRAAVTWLQPWLPSADTLAGLNTAISALVVAASIAAGLLIANAVLPSPRHV